MSVRLEKEPVRTSESFVHSRRRSSMTRMKRRSSSFVASLASRSSASTSSSLIPTVTAEQRTVVIVVAELIVEETAQEVDVVEIAEDVAVEEELLAHLHPPSMLPVKPSLLLEPSKSHQSTFQVLPIDVSYLCSPCLFYRTRSICLPLNLPSYICLV